MELVSTGWASTMRLNVAEAQYALGALDEAERGALEAEELGGADDIVNFAWGRAIRACIAADRGDRATADELARDAVRYALETDFPIVHGDVYRALAHVEHAAGRHDEERAALQQALAAYSRKQILPMVELTRGLLAATPTG